MLCICVALHCEAQPLIEHFKLVKDTLSRGQALFRGANITLIESGPGKIKAAAAVTRLLSTLQSPADAMAINFGTCGSAQDHPRGEVFIINKISDASSENCFYPDILFKHSLPEAHLATFEKPVSKQDSLSPTIQLVDMEASGFFEAASIFLAPSRIACLKIVSDNLEGKSISNQEIKRLVRENLPAISKAIQIFAEANADPGPAKRADIKDISRRLASHFRLTRAQEEILYKAMQHFAIRTNSDLGWTERFLENTVQSKPEAKKAFTALIAALNKTAT